MNPEYAAFLAKRAVVAPLRGIENPPAAPSHLFKYQGECASFGLRAGSWACWLGTGLGKTRIELWWGQEAARLSNGKALILTPLAVARQIEAEGKSLGYDVRVIRSQDEARPGINVCNYDRMDALRPDEFGAVALDESSILKSFTGKTSRALIDAFGGHRWRMSATATPAPNDHVEVAQQAHFCGVMNRDEMLVRWFLNDSSDTGTWRLKGHAVRPFWDWCATWAQSSALRSHGLRRAFVLVRDVLPGRAPLLAFRSKAEGRGASDRRGRGGAYRPRDRPEGGRPRANEARDGGGDATCYRGGQAAASRLRANL